MDGLNTGVVGLIAIVVTSSFGAIWKLLKIWQEEQEKQRAFDIKRMAELERIGTNCHLHTTELREEQTRQSDRTNKIIEKALSVIESNAKIIGAIERRLNGGLKK